MKVLFGGFLLVLVAGGWVEQKTCPGTKDLVLRVPFDRVANCGSNVPLDRDCSGQSLVRDLESNRSAFFNDREDVYGRQVADLPFPANGSGLGLCVWVKYPADHDFTSRYDRIVEWASSYEKDFTFFALTLFSQSPEATKTRLRLRVKDKLTRATATFMSGHVLGAGVWYHVCVTVAFQPESLVQMWLNGQEILVDPPTTSEFSFISGALIPPDVIIPFRIAGSVVADQRHGYDFEGRMHSLLLFSHPFNSMVVQLIYADQCNFVVTPLTPTSSQLAEGAAFMGSTGSTNGYLGPLPTTRSFISSTTQVLSSVSTINDTTTPPSLSASFPLVELIVIIVLVICAALVIIAILWRRVGHRLQQSPSSTHNNKKSLTPLSSSGRSRGNSINRSQTLNRSRSHSNRSNRRRSMGGHYSQVPVAVQSNARDYELGPVVVAAEPKSTTVTARTYCRSVIPTAATAEPLITAKIYDGVSTHHEYSQLLVLWTCAQCGNVNRPLFNSCAKCDGDKQLDPSK